MARAGGILVPRPILCLPPATGELPEEGGLVVSSLATPTRKPIEHAGHSYQQQLIRTHGLDRSIDVAHPADKPVAEKKAQPALRAHDGDAAKTLASKMAVGSDDLYELLELGEKRWHATADDIKKSFRRISLIYHPDKISHHGDEAKANAESHFKAVMKAYDVLSDKKKRAAYDSVDDVDDTIPSEKDATASPKRFFDKFGACFALNARWCVSDRVPELGDDTADMETVDRFYDFWYCFKSWRDFSYGTEYDLDQADCREEKRWMERQNAKEIKKKKLDENARIRRLVDLAYKHDPRIKRAKEAARAKKDAVKEEKKRKAEEARRSQEEKEELQRIEAEKKAAEDRVKRAAAKKQKDAARQIVRKARQKLRAVARDLGIMETDRGLVAVEGMCANGDAESIEALSVRLSDLPRNESTADLAYSLVDAALTEPTNPVSTSTITSTSAKVANLEDMTDSSSLSQEAEADTDVELKKDVPNVTELETKVESTTLEKAPEAPWTQEELSLLSKAVAKFPGGTRNRWERLANYLGTRSPDEVLRKVNENRPSRIKPGTLKQAVFHDSEGKSVERLQEKTKVKPVPSKVKPAARSSASPASQPPNKFQFTPKQQALFENALKKHPKGESGRWKKVGSAVGRTPEHCQERFNELISYYAAKRAPQ